MIEEADTFFWQALVLPENHRIASNPSPFGLQTRQIRAVRGICGSLGTAPPALGVPCGFGSVHPEVRWFQFYGNQRGGRALPRNCLTCREDLCLQFTNGLKMLLGPEGLCKSFPN